MPCNARGRGRLGFVSTSGGGSSSGGGGVDFGGASLDLAPLFSWFQSASSSAASVPDSLNQVVSNAKRQVQTLAQRVAALKAQNEAEDRAIDQAQAAAASCASPATWSDWARCYRTQILMGAAGLAFLALVLKKRGRR